MTCTGLFIHMQTLFIENEHQDLLVRSLAHARHAIQGNTEMSLSGLDKLVYQRSSYAPNKHNLP
jgi:hypothetical protein